MTSSQQTKSTIEKFRGHILQAFESVLGSPVTLEIRCESNRDAGSGSQLPLILPANKDSCSVEKKMSEIVEEETASPRDHRNNDQQVDLNKKPIVTSHIEKRRLREQGQSRSIVKSKVSLAHVIQQAEGHSQRSGWSKRKAVSIAEKLEQENLYVVSLSTLFFL